MPREPAQRRWKSAALVASMLLAVLLVAAIARFSSGPDVPTNATATVKARFSPQPAAAGEQATPTVNCGTGVAWGVVPSPNKAPDKPGEAGEGGSSLAQIAASSDTDAWAVGMVRGEGRSEALIEHWDGTSWGISPINIPEGESSTLSSIAVLGSNDVWAVGLHVEKVGATVPLAAHWNGATWTVTANPAARSNYRVLTGISAASSGDVWAVGYSVEGGSAYRTFIQRWNGGRWNVIASPSTEPSVSRLEAVKAISTDDVWAVGYYFEAGAYKTLVEHWDGNSWSVMPTPDRSTTANYLTGVAALSPDDVWAVGYSSRAGGAYETLVQHWDGKSWSIVPSPSNSDRQSILSSASVAPGSTKDVWAAGYYLSSIGKSLKYEPLLERWDGTKWAIVDFPAAEFEDRIFKGVWARSSEDVWAVGYRNSPQSGQQTLIGRFNNRCGPSQP